MACTISEALSGDARMMQAGHEAERRTSPGDGGVLRTTLQHEVEGILRVSPRRDRVRAPA